MKDEKVKVKRPLVRKLLLWIGLPLLLVYIVVILFTYFWSGDNALKQMKEYLFELTSHHASMLDGKFLKVSRASMGIADAIEEFSIPTKNELYSLMKKKLSENSDIYGMAIAFNPFAYNNNIKLFSPYVYRTDKDIADIDLAKSYDYTLQDWFMIPKLLGTSYWGEPYYDEGGGDIFMATYSQPMYKNGKFFGISTADISLDDLELEMSNIRIMAGHTFIITRTGTFIYHSIKEYIMNESIFSLAEEDDQPELREIGKKMIAGEQGITTFRDVNTGEKSWLVYSPIPDCHWSFAAVIPDKEIMKTVNSMVIRQIAIMVIGLLIILLVILWAAIGITNPIKKLLGFANRISKGDLDEKITGIRGHDEIHELVKAFNKMTYDLKHYISDLTAATKAKESVESELRIARQIQESLLPRIFPPFPDTEEFDLYARNIPAKEVAGDFFDFFMLDDDHIAIIIADVSGKGISAGLFMAVTRTLMKTVCVQGVPPAEAMEKANIVLCQDNDACMFTTLFLAIYNIKTGHMHWTNAGHDEPIIISEDGSYRMLKTFKDIALGINEFHKYHEGEAQLEIGEKMVLYTDGVIEATSPENELYGEERFIKILRENAGKSLVEIIDIVTEDLDGFQKDNQFDDITILLLKREK